MSDRLEKAVAEVRALPSEQQDEIAEWLMQWTFDDMPDVVLTAEEERSFVEPLAQAARRDFVSDEALSRLWAKHRR